MEAAPYEFHDPFMPRFIKEHREEEFLRVNKPKSRVVVTVDGIPIRGFRSSKDSYILWSMLEPRVDYSGVQVKKTTLVYYMLLKHAKLSFEDGIKGSLPSKLNGARGSFQAEVWRGPQALGTLDGKSFVSKVFWKILLSGERVILSDSSHSQAGKNFWFARIKEALERGLEAWALDTEMKGSVLKIHSGKELTTLSDLSEFYSSDQDLSGERWRFAIFKR